MKFLQLKFIPESTDFALLLLRLWLGITMFFHHGLVKLMNFEAMSSKFPDLIGIGHLPSLILVTFAEVVCSALLALGLLTRFAALVLIIDMGVAFVLAHGMKFAGPGELAFLYFGGFVALLFGGGGRFAYDSIKG